jgi:hypothetical protein
MTKYGKETRVRADVRGLGLPADYVKGHITQVMDDEVVCLDLDRKVGTHSHLVLHTKRLRRLVRKVAAL